MTIKGYLINNRLGNTFNLDQSHLDLEKFKLYLTNNGFSLIKTSNYNEIIFNNFKIVDNNKYYYLNHKIISYKPFIKIKNNKKIITSDEVPNINFKYYHQINNVEKFKFKNLNNHHIIICKKNNNIIIYFKGNLDECFNLINKFGK